MTTPTLSQLKLHGITPVISEAWVWDSSNRYLDLAAKVLADGRKHPDPLIVKTIKDLYTRTTGKIGEPRRWPTQQHLNRRDWYFTIVAQSRFAIDLQLTKIFRDTGAMPLAVDHDAVFYASDNPDPVAALARRPHQTRHRGRTVEADRLRRPRRLGSGPPDRGQVPARPAGPPRLAVQGSRRRPHPARGLADPASAGK